MKKIFIFLIIILLLGAGVWWYRVRSNKIANVKNSVDQQTATPTSLGPPAQLKAGDRDSDALNDDEEKKLGTDPNDFDTDGDGLTDGDEVNMYHTDPKKFDTDGDGFGDGLEVLKGYNPLGSGRLVTASSTIKKP